MTGGRYLLVVFLSRLSLGMQTLDIALLFEYGVHFVRWINCTLSYSFSV